MDEKEVQENVIRRNWKKRQGQIAEPNLKVGGIGGFPNPCLYFDELEFRVT